MQNTLKHNVYLCVTLHQYLLKDVSDDINILITRWSFIGCWRGNQLLNFLRFFWQIIQPSNNSEGHFLVNLSINLANRSQKQRTRCQTGFTQTHMFLQVQKFHLSQSALTSAELSVQILNRVQRIDPDQQMLSVQLSRSTQVLILHLRQNVWFPSCLTSRRLRRRWSTKVRLPLLRYLPDWENSPLSEAQ